MQTEKQIGCNKLAVQSMKKQNRLDNKKAKEVQRKRAFQEGMAVIDKLPLFRQNDDNDSSSNESSVDILVGRKRLAAQVRRDDPISSKDSDGADAISIRNSSNKTSEKPCICSKLPNLTLDDIKRFELILKLAKRISPEIEKDIEVGILYQCFVSMNTEAPFKITHDEFRTCVTNLCSTLRNPRSKYTRDGSSINARNSRQNTKASPRRRLKQKINIRDGQNNQSNVDSNSTINGNVESNGIEMSDDQNENEKSEEENTANIQNKNEYDISADGEKIEVLRRELNIREEKQHFEEKDCIDKKRELVEQREIGGKRRSEEKTLEVVERRLAEQRETEEKRRREEQTRQVEERRLTEEREAEEKRRKEEQTRQVEERRLAEQREAEEKRRREEKKRRDEERKEAEQRLVGNEKKRSEERQRIDEVQRQVQTTKREKHCDDKKNKLDKEEKQYRKEKYVLDRKKENNYGNKRSHEDEWKHMKSNEKRASSRERKKRRWSKNWEV
ncbi:golgin subfamily A member 6-like protein 22 [Phymastichus coffea]|uniref:golgin subfamily A member 6-like protein 22 n=1 Tax=Phymastichus coffea TaxID=108790 RepID=UPI00273B9715|nr:golgin subfamily A member 6-like protein 22 [Phymastichus coffea]